MDVHGLRSARKLSKEKSVVADDELVGLDGKNIVSVAKCYRKNNPMHIADGLDPIFFFLESSTSS